MGRLTRRTFLQSSAAVAGAAAFSAVPAIGQAKPRVVVIGGGAGGATAAKYIARDSKGAIDVTLVEPLKRYQTCFHSNLYLGGYRSYDSITHGYEKLTSAYGVKMNHQWANAIDRDKKQVVLADGSRLSYDRLVVSPGIALKYDSVPGWGKEHEVAMPHAWLPGEQTQILKKRLDAVPDGGVIVMIAPPNPFRCPPGPYERACMIAHYLKTRKPKSKLIILDPKKQISKQALFVQAFTEDYKGIVEFNLSNDIDNFALKRVDPATREIETVSGLKIKASVANIIPPQKAGAIAQLAGCTEGDWCPIVADNFASAKVADVYVVGDASAAGDMPKSAFSANSQAKSVASELESMYVGKPRYPTRYRNTCWSMLGPSTASRSAPTTPPRRASSRRKARSCPSPVRTRASGSRTTPSTSAGTTASSPTCSRRPPRRRRRPRRPLRRRVDPPGDVGSATPADGRARAAVRRSPSPSACPARDTGQRRGGGEPGRRRSCPLRRRPRIDEARGRGRPWNTGDARSGETPPTGRMTSAPRQTWARPSPPTARSVPRVGPSAGPTTRPDDTNSATTRTATRDERRDDTNDRTA